MYRTPPRASPHIWAAPLPRDLTPSMRRITIRTFDEFGQEHEGDNLIEIGG